MALDFAIVDRSGMIIDSVSIRALTHERLVARMRLKSMPLLQRIEDFYEDATYSKEEVPLLRQEVVDVVEAATGDSDVLEFLQGLMRLLDRSIVSRCGIVVVAD